MPRNRSKNRQKKKSDAGPPAPPDKKETRRGSPSTAFPGAPLARGGVQVDAPPGLSTGAGHPRARSSLSPRGHRFGCCRFPARGAAVRAAVSLRWMARRFAVKASACSLPAQHAGGALALPERLLTSCAHRLRKPHRPRQTSDALCRREVAWPSARRSPGRPSSATFVAKGRPLAARRRAHGCRFRATVLSAPGRLPLVRSSILRSKQAGTSSLDRSLAPAAHPFTHRESAPVVFRGAATSS